jgi:hypothetical protein
LTGRDEIDGAKKVQWWQHAIAIDVLTMMLVLLWWLGRAP